MEHISIKIKQSILKNLNSIRDKTFTETNIKELLIDIREMISQFQILREISDFMAHPNREKGICNNDVDLFYCKMKLVFTNPNPLQFDINKIDKRLFEILFEHGLKRFDEKILIEKTGLKKIDFEYLRNHNYRKKGSWSLLKQKKDINKLINGSIR